MKELLFGYWRRKKGFTLEIKRESSSVEGDHFLVWRKEVKFFCLEKRSVEGYKKSLGGRMGGPLEGFSGATREPLWFVLGVLFAWFIFV